jgi:hypothetical protein
MEYGRDHPAHNRAGYVRQHRLVMECLLGRLLEPDETVHHRDGNKTNNHPDNLELLTRQQHALVHRDEHREAMLVPLTEQQVREALDGRSTLQAAQLLGVNHMTLRNRFPHLLTKRRSPGAPLDPELRRRLVELANDPNVGQREACRLLPVSGPQLRNWLRLEGIQWTSAPVGTPIRYRHRAYGDPPRTPQSPSQT